MCTDIKRKYRGCGHEVRDIKFCSEKDAKALADQDLARAADAENPRPEGAETRQEEAWRTMYDEVPRGETAKVHTPRTLEDGLERKEGRCRGCIYGRKEPPKKVEKRQPPKRDPKRDSRKDGKRKRDNGKRKEVKFENLR